MLAWLESALALLPAFDALAILGVRSAALVALGWLGAALLKSALPGVRQALWTAVVVGLVVLPILTAVLPAWQVLPASFGARQAVRPAVSTTFDWHPTAPMTAAELPAQADPWQIPWTDWTVLLWATGAFAAAMIYGAGLWRLRRVRLAGSAGSVGLRRQAARLARDFGIRRAVRIVVSPRVSSPGTWGLWRPVILLPPAVARWSQDRCRLVLAHEMAHVARGDWAWRLLAQAGCVIYWFNPVAWIAARRLRFEQELACDLAVVDHGARPSLYAHHLLSIARAATEGRALPLAALDMARRSQMEGRLMSILANRPARRLRSGLLIPALAILAALPVVAAIQPEAPSAPEAASTPVADVVAVTAVVPAPDAPAVSAAPSAVVAPSAVTGVAPAVALSAVPSPSAAPAPVVAPSAVLAPEPVAAPMPPVPEGSVYGALAATEVLAPVAPLQASPTESAVPTAPHAPALAPVDRAREAELEARIEAKAAEIEALVGPIHEEIERAMTEGMGAMLEQMEALEFEMRPVHEELSRIGEEMSQRMRETMPAQLEMEELSRRAEVIALAMEERSRLTEQQLTGGELDHEALAESARELRESLAPQREELERLHREMQEQHLSTAAIQEAMEPYRERMEALRESMEPQRERMEELRRQFEPRREEMERLRDERMAEVREHFDALRAELQALSEEMSRTRLESRDER